MEVILVTGRAEPIDLSGQQRGQPALVLSRAGQALTRDDDVPCGKSPYFFFICAGPQTSAKYDKQVQAGCIG
jgi:hypothetical protein